MINDDYLKDNEDFDNDFSNFLKNMFFKTQKTDYIPFLDGRPASKDYLTGNIVERDNVIDSEDISNLIIALATSESLEDFLKIT